MTRISAAGETPVSVVIPTYNRAGFLPAAVQSVRDQSYPCFEIVIVDDGSTDDTAQVVTGLGSGIKYVRQENTGPSAARNRGILESSGSLIAFLDTDDRWLPDKLARQVRVLDARPSIALVASDEAMESGSGQLLFASNFAHRGLNQILGQHPDGLVPNAPSLLLRINFVSTSTVLVRRTVLLDLGGFNQSLRYGEDLDLWLRIAAEHDIACVRTVEAVRVTHGLNTTSSVEPMLKGYVELAKEIRHWAGPSMQRWGVHADRYVAESLNDLGYWYFSQDRPADALNVFLQSLRERTTKRALLYSAASSLPAPIIRWVRRMKS